MLFIFENNDLIIVFYEYQNLFYVREKIKDEIFELGMMIFINK